MKPSLDQSLHDAAQLVREGRTEAAAAIFREVLERYPDNQPAAEGLRQLKGSPQEDDPQKIAYNIFQLYQARRLQEAIDLSAVLAQRHPLDANLNLLIGAANAQLGRFDAALTHYDRAIQLKPDFVGAHQQRGNALGTVGRYGDALASYDEVLRLDPNLADAYIGRGAALKDLKHLPEALAAFDRGLELHPANAKLHDGRANVLQALKRPADALAAYELAAQLQPDLASLQNNLGVALRETGRFDEAIARFDRAIELQPNFARPYFNRGVVRGEQQRRAEAVADFASALRIDPSHARALTQLLHQKSHICDWAPPECPVDLDRLGIEGDTVSRFSLLPIDDDPYRQLARARHAAADWASIPAVRFTAPAARPAKLRIGYFSADFYNHATMYLMIRLFELHDRDRFEIHAFSFVPETGQQMERRLKERVDQFHNLHALGDAEAAALSRSLGIDIAVDLKGDTRDARMGIFAHRAAPIQMSYLGYPGTMGAGFIDYIVADKVVIPENLRQFYDEKVIALPHSYQVNDDTRAISSRAFTRSELGLPEDGFVFCSFNSNYKISPAEFDIWMRLLAKVEGSVLWLLEGNQWARENLGREAASRGIDPSRLVFTKHMVPPEHLARHRCADLFLDTFAVNAHTTASDALWAGLPIVTLLGRSFAGRVCASLLEAVGLGELVTRSAQEYETLALTLATDPSRLAEVRAKLATDLAKAPLFDSERFARNIERAYDLAYERHAAGLAPDHIDVSEEGPATTHTALRSFERAIQNDIAALHAVFREGKHQEAADLGATMVERYPKSAEPYRILGLANAQLRRFDMALKSFDGLLQLQPGNAEAHYFRGNALSNLGRPTEALASFEAALRLKPDLANAWYNRGNLLSAMQRYDDATASYGEAIRHKPAMVNAYNNRGIALNLAARPEEALASFDAAIGLQPDRADILNNRGAVLHKLHRLDEALAAFDGAIGLQPALADAHRNRGNALRDLKRREEALSSYDTALRLNPKLTDAHHNRGVVLTDLNRLEEAVASFDEGLKLHPNLAELHKSRGDALLGLARWNEALVSYQAALRLHPNLAAAHVNRAAALKELSRPFEALASVDEALRLEPQSTRALYIRGNVLVGLGRAVEAIADFEGILRIDPGHVSALGMLLQQKAQLCDWSEPAQRVDFEHIGMEPEAPVAPFAMLSLEDSPLHHCRRAKTWALAEAPVVPVVFARPAARPNRLRIGYFSADFHEHATMMLIARVLEVHNRDRFEVHAFSYGAETQDTTRERAVAAVDRFHNVRDLDHAATAKLARENKIDIAVDLKGYTRDTRSGIFAHRAAPVQMNYLGFPGTMGADYIDYIVADQVVIPPELRSFYTEKVIALPNCYQANDDRRAIETRQYSRTDLSLPEQAFVFCCFNNNYKISPAEFDVWMRLLAKVEGSVLWLLEANRWARENLKREAAARGIDPERIVFAPRMVSSYHLARHRCADLFLDTFNYNAHTTGSDALWAGLPIVTRLGQSFAARVGASLLEAVGMGELVTRSTEEYEALALALATDPPRLAAIRAKLAANLPTAPLFDTRRFTRDLERAYELAYDRYFDALSPDHIDVAA